MAQDPLHVLWVEPTFPGRLGAVADWLVRRRGYRSSFYCHTADPRSVLAGVGRQGARRPGFWRRRRRTRVGRGLVAGTRAQPLLCLRLLGSPRKEAAAADRSDRGPFGGPGLGALRAGLLAGRSGRQLPRLLLPRPSPRPGRRGRARDPAGLLSLAAVDGRDRSPGSGAGLARLDSHPLAAPSVSRRVSRRIPGLARWRRHPPLRRFAVACDRPWPDGRLPAG